MKDNILVHTIIKEEFKEINPFILPFIAEIRKFKVYGNKYLF